MASRRLRRLEALGEVPTGRASAAAGGRSRPPARRRLAGLSAAALLGVAAAGGLFAATPHDHVSRGCFWWVATTVDRVVAGDRGCVRGWFFAGSLAEADDNSAHRLAFLPPEGRRCPFRNGDAVVVSYQAIFDDGRTIIQATDCR